MQFAVAALYELRKVLNQKPAVANRGYKKTKLHYYRLKLKDSGGDGIMSGEGRREHAK